MRISIGVSGLLDKHPAADGPAAGDNDCCRKVAAMLDGVEAGGSDSGLDAGGDVPHFNFQDVRR